MPNDHIITVTNLVKKYGEFTAVKNVSFSVTKGDIFAFLGPNGAGKTTTIKMLTTLLTPTEGSINIAGHDPVKDHDSVRRSFGIVFQDPSLDDELTAFENLQFHAYLYGVKDNVNKKIQSLLEFVELWDRKDNLVKTFSGGMKRRLEIARGLLHHPQIFFMDEPTQGLDPQTRNHLWSYIKNLNQTEKLTVFFTTHYIEEAEKMANLVAVIDHGQIVATGSPKELIKQTNTSSLEEAFLQLTGHDIRADEASAIDHLRQMRQMRRR